MLVACRDDMKWCATTTSFRKEIERKWGK